MFNLEEVFLTKCAKLTSRRVEVEGLNRTVTQPARRDGKNSSAGADVQKGLRLSVLSAGHQLFQTKCRCRMLSGAETQTRIKHHNALTCSWFTLAPAWLHQQCLTEFQWLEVFFPRLGPVLTADFSNRDSASINAPAALPDLSQAAAQ